MKQEFESPHLAKQLKQNNMENILRKLMSTRCVSMHNPSMRCHGKGCDGQCAQFQMALMELNEATTNKVKAAIDEMHFYNTVAEYEEIIR